MLKILLIFAVAQEAFQVTIPQTQIIQIITGVGKTAAGTAVARAICEHKPDLVLNIGTVGTYRHKVGDILVSRHFIDRDMSRVPIDGLCRELDMQSLSFGYNLRSIIDGKASDQPVTINTGDNFVMNADEDMGCDAVDMESFAMAYACKQANVPFLSIKYVTDILGQNTVAIWADKLAAARKDLSAYIAANAEACISAASLSCNP